MKKFISIFLLCLMILSLPMSAFATSGSDYNSTNSLVLKDSIKDTDGTNKTIEVYENASGRTAYVKNLNGNIEFTCSVSNFNKSKAIAKKYLDGNLVSQQIIPLAEYSRRYTKNYSYSSILDAGGKVISVAAVVALIYASAGGATVVSVSIKKQIAKILGGLTASFISDTKYMKSHGISVRYYQYTDYVYRKGKKVAVVKTTVSSVGAY